MNDGAQFLTLPGVRLERVLAGGQDEIWALLTDPARLPGWYGDAVIEPRAGGQVRLMGGHVQGVVTQWRPPHRLAYSWNVFAPGETVSAYPESYLLLELEGQVLTLTHLPVLERFEKQNAMGWHSFLDMLEHAAAGEPARERAHYMSRNAARYGVDLDDLTR